MMETERLKLPALDEVYWDVDSQQSAFAVEVEAGSIPSLLQQLRDFKGSVLNAYLEDSCKARLRFCHACLEQNRILDKDAINMTLPEWHAQVRGRIQEVRVFLGVLEDLRLQLEAKLAEEGKS